MSLQPYVVLSAAVSLDGRLDDASPHRLVLSHPRDLDRVDEERAAADAILIGATTLRRDHPRLLVSDAARRRRVAAGRPEHPAKVVVSGSGDLDPTLAFWHCGGEKLVFTVDAALVRTRRELGAFATVTATGSVLDWQAVLAGLGRHGVRRLLVEGGGTVHTQLLALDLADELHLAVAPLLVGSAQAPRFLGDASYPGGSTARMRLLETRVLGDTVLLRYAPRDRKGSPTHLITTGDDHSSV
ncbi:RibD family protein [Streptomyces polyrhachis]|uniref:RibD family protein n=1 Tax=Streptomyces polyrhachis TaxID=1282885 RepID=A0ABW2GLX2_9ACTN